MNPLPQSAKKQPPWAMLTSCKICGNKNLSDIFSLGEIPMADTFPQEGESAPTLSASICLCPNCSLVQLREIVQPEFLFGKDYPYYTSVSSELREHFAQTAEKILEQAKAQSALSVIEAASNDGLLLSLLQKNGWQTLGIEPASGPAEKAIQNGVKTENRFFNYRLAAELKQKGIACDIFCANNVIAHVPEPVDFVKGISLILHEDGFVEMEFPWILETIRRNEFDQIFHQHYSYFSLHAMKYLLSMAGLAISEAEKIPLHGGSLRIFARKNGHPSNQVNKILEEEKKEGIFRLDYYTDFKARVHQNREKLRSLLQDLKQKGKTISGYGAAGKAATLLSFCNIGRETLDNIADISPHKQGRFFPSGNIPIISPEELKKNPPDYLLILAWNFAEPIMKQLSWFSEQGGKFIIPVPEPRICD